MSQQHFDVLIVGAGLSGIGAGYHLQTQLPGRDVRDPRGARRHRRHLGPVPLSRHPLGLRHVHARLLVPAVDERRRRSPTAPSILEYIRETARELRHRPQHPLPASRDAARRGRRDDARWTVEVERGRTARPCASPATSSSCAAATTTTTRATRPSSPGVERFAGRIVHPQKWTEDIDYAGKRVVVIGSGATAVTLVPEMAKHGRARHDAAALADVHRLAARAGSHRELAARRSCPPQLAYGITRWKNVLLGMSFYRLCRRSPECAKKLILEGRAATSSGPTTTSRKHFTPALQPVGSAAVPRAGRRSVRGAQRRAARRSSPIRSRRSPRRASGCAPARSSTRTSSSPRPASICIVLGGMELDVDGSAVDLAKTLTYKGMMYSDVPNLALGVRLHERVVDAEVRSHLRVRVPAAEPHGRARLSGSARRGATIRRSTEKPLIDFTPATCSDRSTSSRSRERRRRGAASELRARHHGAEVRRRRGRRDGVLQSGATERAGCHRRRAVGVGFAAQSLSPPSQPPPKSREA